MSELQSHGKCLNLQGLLQPKFHDAVAVILKLEWHQSPLVGLVKTAELTRVWFSMWGRGPRICISRKFPGDPATAGPTAQVETRPVAKQDLSAWDPGRGL